MRSLYLWLSVGFPCLLSLAFNLQTNTYPRADEAEYFMQAYEILNFFKNDGFWQGIVKLYEHRLWKPSLHGVLAFPFVALLQNNVLVANALVIFTLTFIILFFSFKTFRIFLNDLSSGILTLGIGVLPWFIHNTHIFRAQTSFLAFLSAGIYFGIKSVKEEESKSFYLTSIFLALSFCTRPVEALLTAFPLALVLLYTKRKDFEVRWNLYYLIMSMILLSSLIILDMLQVNNGPLIRFGIYLSWMLILPIYFMSKKIKGAQIDGYRISIFVIIFGAIVCGWFLNYFKLVHDWAFIGALHEHMKNVWQRPDGDYFIFFKNTFLYLHNPLLIPLSACLFLQIFFGKIPKSFWSLIVGGLILSLLPLTLGSASLNGSYWFFFNGSFLTLICLSVAALYPSSVPLFARQCILVLCVCYMAIDPIKNVIVRDSYTDLSYNKLSISADPCPELVSEIDRLIGPRKQIEIGIMLYQGQSPLFGIYDRWCLNLVNLERGNTMYRFRSYWNGFPWEDFDFVTKEHRQFSKYLLFGENDGFQISNKKLEQNHIVLRLEQGLKKKNLPADFEIFAKIKPRGVSGSYGDLNLLVNTKL